MNRRQLDKIIELVTEAIEPHGYECIEAEWLNHDKILRLFIDNNKAEGIQIDDCVKVNAIIEDVEALNEFLPSSYQLEVSSPGVERPLRQKAHFASSIGKTVKVNLLDNGSDRQRKTGKVVGVSDDGVVTMESDEGIWSFSLDHLNKAHVVFDWNQVNLD